MNFRWYLQTGHSWKAGRHVRLDDFSSAWNLHCHLTAFKTTQIWHLSTGSAGLEKISSVSSPAVSVFIIHAMNVVNYTRHTAITQELPFIVKLKFDQMTSRWCKNGLGKLFKIKLRFNMLNMYWDVIFSILQSYINIHDSC